jgi:tetratricopeptide (TPR) repeat protein
MKRMNRFFFLLFLLTLAQLSSSAQEAAAKTPQETARAFTRQGDYTNALVVLNEALKKDPQNLELLKDMAFNYYLEKEFDKGLAVAKPMVERPDADVQAYQVLALFYKAINETKECEKLYKAGIKRFPRSGVLYSEYGEMLWARQDYAAIKQWEKGIEIDPNYSTNYYNAARYYFFTQDKVWALLYGEIFLNLESYSKRTAEIKDLLLEGYKKLFTDANMQKNQDTKSPFVLAYLNTIDKLGFTIAQGITTESLTVLRTKFIINWFNTYPSNFPFRLFDYQRQLLKDGMYDAYNQWLFGTAENLPVFQAWCNTHGDEYSRFVNFQKGRIFKLPEGQYYQVAAK